MKFDVIASPGSLSGPCSCDCSHPACLALRAVVSSICPFCGSRIGYNEPYYSVFLLAPGVFTYSHQACLFDAIYSGIDGDETS